MTVSGKGRIFISYRRGDSAGYAGRIFDRLSAHFGAEAVFMDVDTIEAGLDFVAVLQNAVQSCDVLVALIGRSWLNITDEAGKRRLVNPEDFVRVEIAAALSRDIRVIPVLVDGAPMPRSTELPGNLKPLARRNALQVNHYSFNADVHRLISQLELGLKAAEESKILKSRVLQEEHTRAKRQAEIERLLGQADLAFSLKDWNLAYEKLKGALALDASHMAAQDKLDIVQRKLSEIEREHAEQAGKEKAAREQATAEERAPFFAEQKARKEREDQKRREAEEKAGKEKEERERKATEKEPEIRYESSSPKGRGARGEGKPAWLPYGIGGGVVLAFALIFGLGYLIQNALTPDSPTATNRPPTEAPATSVPTGTAETQVAPTGIPEELGVGSTLISEKDGMLMAYVPAGEFQMGSENGESDEKPVHIVYLNAFWIDQTEVTNSMYAECVEAGECNRPSDTTYYNDSSYADHPVVYISWNDANAYCSWVDRRLPTEAEWEIAASWNPVASEKFVYPWGNDFDCKKGNFDDETRLDSYVVPGGANCDGFDRTSPVGSFSVGASPYGVLDMAGNVWEWVADWYAQDYYASSPSSDPKGPDSGSYRVLRGGTWLSTDDGVRSAFRFRIDPANTDFIIGFRCARSP